MPRFEVKHVQHEFSGDRFSRIEDTYSRILDTETGQYLTVAHQGSSPQELVFRYGDELVNVIYGHQDYADFLAGLKRSDVPRVDLLNPKGEQLNHVKKILQLMKERPAWAGCAYLDLANRTPGGKGAVICPRTREVVKRWELGINHPESKSFIHGNAMFHEAAFEGAYAGDDCGQLKFRTEIGVGLEQYPKGVYDVTTFVLGPDFFEDLGTITNTGKDYVAPCVGRHSSYLLGKEGLSNHILMGHFYGSLDVDDAKNPTGKVTRFSAADEFQAFGLGKTYLDTNFLPMRGKQTRLVNAPRMIGLRMEAADEYTNIETIWTHELTQEVAGDYQRQFAAVEYLIQHSAATGLPLILPYDQIAPELHQVVLAPGNRLSYKRVFKPEMMR